MLVDIGGETCAEGLGDVFAPEGEEVGLCEDEESVGSAQGEQDTGQDRFGEA